MNLDSDILKNKKIKKALLASANAIYFSDSSDYLSHHYEVIRNLTDSYNVDISEKDINTIINKFNSSEENNLIKENLEDELIKEGFIKNKNIITNSYSYDISRNDYEFKEICCYTDPGVQYVYLRQGDLDSERSEDDIVNIFNGDYNGELTIEFIKKVKQLFI